jgi:methionine-rich copper-binding protein CopC
MGRVLTAYLRADPTAAPQPAARLHRKASSILAGLGVALLVGLAGTGPGAAHAELEKISPADGATVGTPPSVVVMTFSEDVSSTFAVVQVKGPGGEPVSQGRPHVQGAVVTQPLAASLAAGRYTVAYRVVSSDGHPVSDTTSFTIAAGTPSSTAASATPPSSPTATVTRPSVATTRPPTDVFDSSHIPGFAVVGLLVLGAVLLLLWERRRGHH